MKHGLSTELSLFLKYGFLGENRGWVRGESRCTVETTAKQKTMMPTTVTSAMPAMSIIGASWKTSQNPPRCQELRCRAFPFQQHLYTSSTVAVRIPFCSARLRFPTFCGFTEAMVPRCCLKPHKNVKVTGVKLSTLTLLEWALEWNKYFSSTFSHPVQHPALTWQKKPGILGREILFVVNLFLAFLVTLYFDGASMSCRRM